MLAKEMDKLTLYVGMGGEITPKLVAELVPKSVEQNVFALTEKVVKKDIAGAMQILDGLFTQQEEPIKLLALLVSQFRLLHQVKELQQRGYGQNQIASHIGVHPYRVKLAMNQTKFFSFEELKKVIMELAEADYSMKTGKMDKKTCARVFLNAVKSYVMKQKSSRAKSVNFFVYKTIRMDRFLNAYAFTCFAKRDF